MRLRIVYVLMLCLLGFALSPVGAQDVPAEVPPSETPTDIPTETPTDVPTEPATVIPTETPTDIPTELPTEVPTETATEAPTETVVTETLEPVDETTTPSVTPEVTLTTPALLTPEPALSLVARELFEIEPLMGWTLPAGWVRTAVSDGFALRVDALAAGNESAAALDGPYYNVAVMGYFTFTDATGAAQLIIRDSLAGSYVAQLDANGAVRLEKRDGNGTVVASWNAATQATVGSAHSLRLSAMSGVLRVAVDNVEVLAVEDITPLPPGAVKVGAQFSALADGQPVNGAILFDNFFLWIPTSEVPVAIAPTSVPPTLAATEFVSPTSTPVSSNVNGKSTIPQASGLMAGPLATSNDNFADREFVNLPYNHTSNTADNSVEPPNEPTPSCGFNISYTAWYEFTPPAGAPTSEQFLFTTIGSTFDTMIAVYTGTWGSLTEVGCADDTGTATQAQLTATLNDGVTYYIQLGGYNGSYGSFNFNVIRPAQALVPGTPVISGTASGAPSTPIGNAGRTNLSQPVIAWNASGTVVPYSYEVQVATTNNFAALVAATIVNEPTRFFEVNPALPLPSLAAGQVYYWRVRARNFLLQSSAWSSVYSFTLDQVIPSAPGLIAPALNGVSLTLRPTFRWQAVADANLYNIRVTTNFSCATLVSGAFDVQTAATSYTFPTDLVQGEYWFCVQSRDAAGNWSNFIGEKRHFVVNISLTPANGGLVVVQAPKTTADVPFTWTSIPGASYKLSVATDSSFTSFVIYDLPVAGTSYTAVGVPFGSYYWRVTVNGMDLPASLAKNVIVTPPVPLAPAIQTVGPLPSAVKNAGFTNDTTPILDWTAPTNWTTPPLGQSIYYELQLSTNSTFTALVIPPVIGMFTTDYEWTNTTLPNTTGTPYYWRVRAITNLGIAGNWSSTFSFTLDTTAPNAPASLTAPVDNFISTAARPTFTWTAPIGGASSYRFEISPDSSDFSQEVIPDAIVTTLRYAPTISLPQGTYYWQVWGIDAAGNESLLPAGFRMLIVDYRTAPVTNFAVVTTTTGNVTFSWALVTGAPSGTTYTIEIDTDLDDDADITAPPVTAARTVVNALVQGTYQYRLVVNNSFGTSGWRKFYVSPPLPGAPTAPFTPANTANVPVTPTLEWHIPTVNAGSVAGYKVEIASNANFANPIAGSPFDVGNVLTYTPATLSQGVYYWRVRAYNTFGAYGAYSAVLSFTLDTTEPNAPASLTAPVDNAVSTAARPTFTWTAPIGGASSYRFEISTDSSDFDPPAIPDAIVTTLRYVPTVSLPQGTYYWQVWAIDAAGNESLSPTGFRTLIVDYRTAPAANFIATTTTSATVTFSWALVTGAPSGTTYTVEIDDNFDANVDITAPAVTAARTTVSGLAQGDYQYRLVVSNGFGTSGWRPFFVSPLLPGAPAAPFTPANTANVPVAPTLEWHVPTVNPGNVAGYMVEIATDVNFSSPIAGSPFDVGNVFTYTPLVLSQGTYYWRVRAKTALNLFGAYTPTLRFTLDTTRPPYPPNLTAPLDNAITNLPRPTFTWAAAPEANRYVIEIDDESSFNNPLFHTATITGTTYTLPSSIYLRQGTYYWRVWAMDAAGNLNFGPISFRTLNVNYAKTPADNGFIISAAAPRVTFTWSAVPITPVMANVLRVQIDNNSDFSSPDAASSPLLASNITTYTTSLTLPYGKYYWRLTVTGHPTLPAGLAGSFTISPPTPSAPALSALPAATKDTTPQFTWSAVSSPSGATVTGYELQLSTTNTFTVLVGGVPISIPGGGTTSYEWAAPLPETAGQAYYARIRAMTSFGIYSNWSAVRSFTLDTIAPDVPVLTGPANNTTVTTPTPTFTWARVTGAVRYEIRYGTSPNLTGVSAISVTTTLYRVPTALMSTNYYWEVRALDAAGNAIDWDDGVTWNPITNRRTVKIVVS